MSLLCQGWGVAVDRVGGLWGWVWGLVEEVPYVAGEVAFEAAVGLGAGFSFGHFAVEVGAGVRAGAGACERDAVERGVELAIAAAVQADALGVAGGGGDGRDA